jgi:WD40 repeat protein
MRVLPGPTKSNGVLAWSPDGRFIAASGKGVGITVWDVDAGTPGHRVLSAGHGGEAMTFCRATGRLYVAFRAGGVWTYDPNTGEERRRRSLDDRIGYLSPAVSTDGRTVVLTRYGVGATGRAIVGYAVVDDGPFAEVWTWPTPGGPLWTNFVFRPGTDQLFGLRMQGHGKLEFFWVTASTGALIGTLPLADHMRSVAHWTLSPDGSCVAWLFEHGLYLQRLDESEPRVIPAASGEWRRGLAWAPDGRTLAYTSGSTVRLLDAGALSEVRAFDWGTGKARAVAFSPDGLRAAVSAEGGRGWVTVFDLE